MKVNVQVGNKSVVCRDLIAGLDVTGIMREILASGGFIASFRHDWDVPGGVQRSGGATIQPETVPLNHRPRAGKGDTIKITSRLWDYAESLNDDKGNAAWQKPNTGLINQGVRFPQTLNFGGNLCLVKKTVSGKYGNVWAVPRECENLASTWFTPNGRLAIMKLVATNAETHAIRKIGAGLDVYFPFLTNQPDYYVELKRLEFWKTPPFALSDGTVIIEYETLGDDINGWINDTEKICLFSPSTGFQTSWKLKTLPPPSQG